MYLFILFLILGFGFNIASTFTFAYSEKFGRQKGTFLTILMRDIFGIPLWAAGFVLAIRSSDNLLFSSSALSLSAGWIFILGGATIILIALISIRLKAAAPGIGDELVSSGLYSIVRHPVHCGTFLEFLGLFFFWPSLNLGISCVLGFTWIIIQSRLEERDLLKRIPGYRNYIEKVPAFFPALRKKSSSDYVSQ